MLKICSPFNGAVLTHRNGIQKNDTLTIQVQGTAPFGAVVKVNGVEAKRNGELFTAPLTIDKFETEIVAEMECSTGKVSHSIRVVWDKHSFKRYRFSIDDNVFWLRELMKDKPKNINDNLYLGQLKRLHDNFGAKFTLNLFYETPDKEFNLSMMSPEWKSQLQDNAEWMRLTWHAYNEFPDRPYQYATPEQFEHDYELIHSEVARFAGEECWIPPSIVHWCEFPPSMFPLLYKKGVRTLSGYFIKGDERYDISYEMDKERCAYLETHDALMDFASGICLSRVDIIFNNTPVENVIPTLAPNIDDPDNAEYIDLLTHEQYFWPYYFNFRPDHYERIATGLQFLNEHGYKPIWQHEGFRGAPTF